MTLYLYQIKNIKIMTVYFIKPTTINVKHSDSKGYYKFTAIHNVSRLSGDDSNTLWYWLNPESDDIVIHDALTVEFNNNILTL